MVSLAISVANFFYIFIFFVYSEMCSTTEGLDTVVALFLNTVRMEGDGKFKKCH